MAEMRAQHLAANPREEKVKQGAKEKMSVSESFSSLSVDPAAELAAAYAYVPPVVEQKKAVDPDDPFADVELVEWGTKKRRW